MAELRAFIFIDRLQPQTMSYLATWIRGALPRRDMAAQVIEISPGLDIERLTDVALKEAEVRPGVLVVERQFGTLEFHAASPADVRAAASAVLRAMKARESDAAPPEMLASRVVPRIDRQHAFVINRNRLGSMAIGGESLFLMELRPAAYAVLAANEAEKAAEIKVIDYRMIGANGRVYLGGQESEIRAAKQAAEDAIGRFAGGRSGG